jgi:hypothetical protein
MGLTTSSVLSTINDPSLPNLANTTTSTSQPTTTMPTLIAVDVSGSTQNCTGYHGVCKSIISKRQPVTTDIYCGWDSSTRICSQAFMLAHHDQLQGYGGTEPIGVAQVLRDLYEKMKTPFHLIFFSDGLIGGHDVDKLDTFLDERKLRNALTSAEFHLIGDDGMNLSVIAAFARGIPHITNIYTSNGDLNQSSGLSTQDVTISQDILSINSLEELEVALPALERYVISQTMGRSTSAEALKILRAQLLACKAKAIKWIGKVQANKSNSIITDCVLAMNNNQHENAVNLCEKIARKHFEQVDLTPDKRLEELVKMTEGTMRTTFHVPIVSDRLARARVVNKLEPTSLPLSGGISGVGQFPCPITCDEENDVALLLRNPPAIVLTNNINQDDNDEYEMVGGPVSATSSTTVKTNVSTSSEKNTSPLYLLERCPDLMITPLQATFQGTEVAQLIDEAISIRAFKQSSVFNGFLDNNADADNNNNSTTTTTNSHIRGVICLTDSNDDEIQAQYVKATNWGIARVLSADAKVPGQQDLWFLAFMVIVKRHCPNLPRSVIMLMEKQMAWRLRNNFSFASLSGLSTTCTTLVPLQVALYFVLNSSGDQYHDPLLLHVSCSNILIEALGLIGVYIPQHIKDRCRLIQIYQRLKSRYNGAESRKHFPNDLRALYQKSELISNGNRIFYDGAADLNVFRQIFPFETKLGCSPAEIYSLAMLVMDKENGPANQNNRQQQLPVEDDDYVPAIIPKTATEIQLALWMKPLPTPEICWETYKTDEYVQIKISPRTCRPYYYIQPNKRDKTWRDAALDAYGVSADKLFAATRLYGELICETEKWPSENEFMEYAFKKVTGKEINPKTTLPNNARQCYQQIVKDYQDIQTQISPSEFKERYRGSVEIKKRVVMEMDGRE